MAAREALFELVDEVTHCHACPRLVAWRERVAREKRASYATQVYWGRAVPSFGDPSAHVLVVGLAPAAHGGNRTGRMFTGDRSGDWLYAALYEAGFASHPYSHDREDGQRLSDAYLTAVVHCAPPDNKPTPVERDTCLRYLVGELEILQNLQVIVTLGAFAWDGVLRALGQRGWSMRPRPNFAHGVETRVGPYVLLGCYHPSQQNTFTGKLTRSMLLAVFQRARECIVHRR